MQKKEIVIEPLTRIEGHLGLRIIVDERTREVEDAWSVAAMFRGFECILRGRSPELAIYLTSRSCGVCGAAHSNASMLALDMALGAIPEPMGVVLRNLGYAMTDYMYDHATLLCNLEGVDYSQLFVEPYTPSVWKAARETPCEKYPNVHGFKTVADLLRAYNPIIGDPVTGVSMWRLNVYFQRFAKEAGSLIYGKYPHPATIIPGGISTDLTNAEHLLQEYIARLNMYTAWVKYVVSTWFDIAWFFEDVIGYVQGWTYDPPVLLSSGLFDDPEVYSSLPHGKPEDIYLEVDKAYLARFHKPGIAIGRELKTTSFTDMQRNMIELTTTGFYLDWRDKPPFTTVDPKGVKLVDRAANPDAVLIYHEWNKWTIPNPSPTKYEGGPYSWGFEVREVIDNTMYPFEVGPIAKIWVQSLHSYKSKPLGLIRSGGGRVEVTLPETRFYQLVGKVRLPPSVEDEVTFVWEIPKHGLSTTIQRLLARAFSLAMACAAAWENVMMALDYLRAGKLKTSRPWTYPVRSLGVGWCEAPRGAVRHWIVVRDGRIANYQYHAPTTSQVSPRTKAEKLAELGLKAPVNVRGAWIHNSVRSPYEASLIHTKVTEELPPDKWIGLDFVRTIRSFDPCLGCTVHVELKGRLNKLIKRYISPSYHSI